MPYRIKARSSQGHTVTMMDLDYTHKPIRDRKYAQQLADEFARTRGHGSTRDWTGIVEYYSDKDSIQNPNWDRSNGTLKK